LDKELQDYYEDRFTTMATKGWRDLMEDVQGMVDSYNLVANVDSIEDLYKCKGQIDILNWLLTLQEASSRSYDGLTLEEGK
jgi:hypothetical protein